MKLNENFVLRKVANFWVVLPIGKQTVDFSGMLKLNDSGAMLWHILENHGDRDSMVVALTAEYDVSIQRAQADVDSFLDKLIQAGCIEQK